MEGALGPNRTPSSQPGGYFSLAFWPLACLHTLGVAEVVLRGASLLPKVPLRGSRGTRRADSEMAALQGAQHESYPPPPNIPLLDLLCLG